MPEPIETPTTTTPEAGATPATPSTPETPTTPTETPSTPEKPTYDANGRQEVPKDTFISEEEAQAINEGGTPGETTTPTTPGATETPTTDAGKAAIGNETLLAGKYKTPEELQKGFQELGGDPAKYKTTQALEEAYSARLAETTRARQESERAAAERARIENLPANQPTTPVDPAAEANALSEKIIGQMDMSKINNVEDMVKQFVPLLLANLPKPEAGQSMDVAKMQGLIEQRQANMSTLADLEKEVPRLGMKDDPATGQKVPIDPVFRKGFALWLRGNNAEYQRTPEGFLQPTELRRAMKDFLALGGTIADAQRALDANNAANKNGAAATPDNAGATPATPAAPGQGDDILDGIIGAYQQKVEKTGRIA